MIPSNAVDIFKVAIERQDNKIYQLKHDGYYREKKII